MNLGTLNRRVRALPHHTLFCEDVRRIYHPVLTEVPVEVRRLQEELLTQMKKGHVLAP